MAGKVGGRKLASPADLNVRPMMEVVRGAVFNILQVDSTCIFLWLCCDVWMVCQVKFKLRF
jgi:16S rRNA G966 N2-methylase RsmD